MVLKKYIVDTNVLMSLESLEGLVKYCEGIVIIPIYVVEELDNLKTKEAERGFQARRALRNMEVIKDNIDFFIPQKSVATVLPDAWKAEKVDNLLIGYALTLVYQDEDVVMLSNDLNVRIKCESLGIASETYREISQIGKGWVEVKLSDSEFAVFQEGKRDQWNVPLNQYLIIKDTDGYRVRAVYKSLGDTDWLKVNPENLGSLYLGTVSPKDAYQQCAIDSLLEDDFTVITGKAGSGKTLLSLSYCLRQIQGNAREKLVIFANPVKTKGAEQLGFYPGDRTTKLMQNSIGAMLSSKLGDEMGTEMLMQTGKVEILPVSDIRGYEVGPKQIMYITEAQNMSIDLLKLAVQRCAQGSKIILEGDVCTQVDHYTFEGANSGLRRVIDVFEGYDGFSHVDLPNIYRSHIADKAEEL